jgi:septum formation protein
VRFVLESSPVSEKTSLLLASNSPRRRELLALGGWRFDVALSDVDERRLAGEAPGAYVLRLAESKARAVASGAPAQALVLAADTTVVDGDELLGKPVDEADAARMLRQLRGRTHQVYTGLALLRVREGHTLTDLCVTDVPMRDYSDEEIEAYVRSGDPLDKAGAYAIQHPGFQPVQGMAGCYASVMGLPLCHLTRLLSAYGLPAPRDVPLACQRELEYDCPISGAILRGELVRETKGEA